MWRLVNLLPATEPNLRRRREGGAPNPYVLGVCRDLEVHL
jgi:hypothetical protein